MSKASLKRHIEIKHRGKKFKCKKCSSDNGKIFKSANGLRNHYKIFHGEHIIAQSGPENFKKVQAKKTPENHVN